MRHYFTTFFLFCLLLLLATTTSFFVLAQSPSESPGPSPTPSPTPTPTVLPTASPSVSVTPTPTPIDNATDLTCDATWLLEFELYEPSQAVRYGQVDFALTLPGYEYGNVPNNPRIRSAYQYPNTLVFDSSLVITDWDEIGRKYTGYILMESADAVIVEFDLWCKTFTSEEPYTLTRTYTWTIPESGTPLPSPTPNATISDIRYVSFGLALDADPALDPLGIFIKSQVQLRNLKSNL